VASANALVSVHIERQLLSTALAAFADQTGLQLVYQPNDISPRLIAPAVSGMYTPEVALAKILETTGLSYHYVNAKTIAIHTSRAESPPSTAVESLPLGDNRLRMAQADQVTASGDFSRERPDNKQAPQQGGAQLQEIVVTAQKREERLQDVPISISVFDRGEMDRQGVAGLEDIYQITPGVNFQSQGELNTFTIRGISSSGAGAATAGIYIDDVPIQIRSYALSGTATPYVFDLDRVEVLRGPQGTYFGAGAESGTLRFVTPTPSTAATTGYTREGISGIDKGGMGYEVGYAVGGPIVDGVGYRVSAAYRTVGGHVDHYSTIPGGEYQADSNWSQIGQINAALLFQPVDTVKITPKIFLQNSYTHDISAFDPNLSNPSTSTYVNGGLLSTPAHNQLALPQLQFQVETGPVTLTSISAFLYREDRYASDYSDIIPMELGLPLPTNAIDSANDPFSNLQKNITQEIRLQNTDPSSKLKWLAGVWYSLARQQYNQFVVEPNLNNYLLEHTGKDILQTFGCCGTDGLLQPGNLSYASTDQFHERQLAGFAQVDWEVIGNLTLTVGGRYAKQSVDFHQLITGPLEGGTAVTNGSESEHVFTPKYGVSYRLNDSNMFYATVSKGNRMGGANAPFFALPACGQALAALGLPANPGAYQSDYLWNYEVGSKNRLFNNRVEVETSVYHMKWSAMQQSIYVPACATGFTANIGSATSDGFDLSVRAQATENLNLTLAVGYTDAKAAQTISIPGFAVLVNKGEQLDRTQSPWNVTAAAQYRFVIGGGQEAYVRVDDEFHSRNPGPFSFQNPNSVSYFPGVSINEAQNLLNLRLGTIWHEWDIATYAKNVLNDHPLLNVTPLTVLAPVGHAYTLAPRTIGVTANFHW